MSVDLYVEHAESIKREFPRDTASLKNRYICLLEIYVQDSVACIGEEFYGTNMARKGAILFELQGLFI